MQHKTEGIVLKSMEFRERQRIIQLITPDHGLLSVIVRRIDPKNTRLINLTSPLSQAEWVIKPTRGELWSFIDGSLFSLHLPIRQELSRLTAAQSMFKKILSTQLPQKPIPDLYNLLKSFLKRLHSSPSPKILALAFTLKLYLHDGHLSTHPICIQCQKPASFYFHSGSLHCSLCAPPYSILVTSVEWEQLYTLAHTRSFSLLETMSIPHEIF